MLSAELWRLSDSSDIHFSSICCFGEQLFTGIQKFSRLPLYVSRTTVPLSKLEKKRREGKGRRGAATQRSYPSVSCPLSVFFLFVFFLFANSLCEQRQGLAVLSSTTPWLSSKNRANHRDGHTGREKKKKD